MKHLYVIAIVTTLGAPPAFGQRALPGDRDWTGPSSISCALVANKIEWTDAAGDTHLIAINRRLSRSVVGTFCSDATAYILTTTALYGFPLEAPSSGNCEGRICISRVETEMRVDLRRELAAGVLAWAHSESQVYVLRKDHKVYSFGIEGGASWFFDLAGTSTDDSTRMAYLDGCLFVATSFAVSSFDLREPGKVERGSAKLFGYALRDGALREVRHGFRFHKGALYVGEVWAERDKVTTRPTCLGR
jgi:hypothetical protein